MLFLTRVEERTIMSPLGKVSDTGCHVVFIRVMALEFRQGEDFHMAFGAQEGRELSCCL